MKTSVGKAIAKELGYGYYKLNLASYTEPSELK